jgi:hypothetical protein
MHIYVNPIYMRDFKMFGNPYVSLCVYVGLKLCSCLHFVYIWSVFYVVEY